MGGKPGVGPEWDQTESGFPWEMVTGGRSPYISETTSGPGVQVGDRAPPGGPSRHGAPPNLPMGASPEPPP